MSANIDFLRSFLQHKNSQPICHTPVTGRIKETVQCLNWEANIESGIHTSYDLTSYNSTETVFFNIQGAQESILSAYVARVENLSPATGRGIDSQEPSLALSSQPSYTGWRAGTTTLCLLGS